MAFKQQLTLTLASYATLEDLRAFVASLSSLPGSTPVHATYRPSGEYPSQDQGTHELSVILLSPSPSQEARHG